MRPGLRILACLAWSLGAAAQVAPALRASLDRMYPELDALYQDLHRHPERSGQETRTAARMAELLRAGGWEVDAQVGGGVVGVLRNGEGPVALLRTELDALPVQEATGLPCASLNPGVMHACGHDAHMTIWIATARLLASRRDLWRGTVLLVAQPAEETVEGARAMLAAGLLTRFPRPSFALAVHDAADLPAGTVSWTPGWTMAAVNAVDLTIYGRGGHGARPETTVDPIVLAARTVLAVQTIVSREKDPQEPAVVTIGSIHGGAKHNVIPDEVKLQMTVRSYAPEVQRRLLEAIARTARGEAQAAGAPREPRVEVSEGQSATWNDPDLARRLAARLGRELGANRVVQARPDMVSEDFGEFGKAAGIPSVLLRVGAANPERLEAARASGIPLPSLHASTFAPDREPTLKTGALALTLSALEVLGRPPSPPRP